MEDEIIEDGQGVAQTTEVSTDTESQSYSDLLKAQGTDAKQDSPSGEQAKETTTQESEKPSTQQKTLEAIELEILGNKYKGNPELFSKVLAIAQSLGDDSLSALSNAEKLAELKRGYDKQFTQNSQFTSEFRKSLESSFGRVPEQPEIQALGKVYQAYFSDENAKRAIDAIIGGQDITQLFTAQPGQPGETRQQTHPDVVALKQQVESLQTQLKGFYESQQKREVSTVYNSWVDKQSKAGVTISEEIDTAMAPFVSALSQAHPEWDDHKILDEAYRHATIGNTEKQIVSKVLTQADKAKTQAPPKMTTKVGEKPDTELSYSELIRKHVA